MNHSSLILVAAFLSVFAIAKTTGVQYVELDGRLNFTDGQVSLPACQMNEAMLCNMTYLGVEFDADNNISNAYLSEDPDDDGIPASTVDFSPDELGKLQVFRDSQKRVWIKQFQISVRQVQWLNTHTCELAALGASIKSVSDGKLIFSFDTQGLGDSVLQTLPVCENFSGSYDNGKPFTGSYRFVQQAYEPLVGPP